MSLDPTTIIAIASVVAAGVAIVALWREDRRNHEAQRIELYLNVNESFSRAEFRMVRAHAAKSLMEKEYSQAITDLLDFFEEIGFLTRIHALTEYMAWHSFFYYLHMYFNAARDVILEEQKKDRTIWGDVSKLHEQLTKIEMKKRNLFMKSELDVKPGELEEFLREEAEIKKNHE